MKIKLASLLFNFEEKILQISLFVLLSALYFKFGEK